MIAPASERTERAGDVFVALADPTRRKMLEQLSVLGPVTITQLTDVFPITRQAVSKHLDTLHDAGLISTERRGRERIVTFRPEPLRDATDWVAAVEARWDRRLAALAQFLNTDRPTDTDDREDRTQ